MANDGFEHVSVRLATDYSLWVIFAAISVLVVFCLLKKGSEAIPFIMQVLAALCLGVVIFTVGGVLNQ